MSVESSLEAKVIADVALIDSDHIIHADFGEFRPDPPYPRLLFWAFAGSTPIRTNGGICSEWRPYRFWVVTKTTAGSLAGDQAQSLASDVVTALERYVDLPNKIQRVHYMSQFDLQQTGEEIDKRLHVRAVDFRVLVDLVE